MKHHPRGSFAGPEAQRSALFSEQQGQASGATFKADRYRLFFHTLLFDPGAGESACRLTSE
jgi:hypothetical protein